MVQHLPTASQQAHHWAEWESQTPSWRPRRLRGSGEAREEAWGKSGRGFSALGLTVSNWAASQLVGDEGGTSGLVGFQAVRRMLSPWTQG